MLSLAHKAALSDDRYCRCVRASTRERGGTAIELDAGQWPEMGEPASPAEKEVPEENRSMLPDNQVTDAWSRVSLIDQSGRVDEIDLMLLYRQRPFLVSAKGARHDRG